MTFILFIRQAFSSIWANKLRSFLSTLGVIIGISSFVIMLALGEGAKASILKDFEGMTNILTVSKGSNQGYQNYQGENTQQQDSLKQESKNIFTKEIISKVPTFVPGVLYVFPKYQSRLSNIRMGGESVWGNIEIVSQQYMDYKKFKLHYGASFSDQDFTEKKKMVLIGPSLLGKKQMQENPIGKHMQIGGDLFIIAGILDGKGADARKILLPDTTFLSLYPDANIQSFQVVVNDENNIKNIQKNLNYYLYKKSAVEKEKDVDFSIQSNKKQLEQMNKMVGKFTLLLAGIGAIALVVGGIGIMNIMLVSVTERTREIGIRKAIGATNGNILTQFLIESVILTLIGSILAILFSFGVTKMIAVLVPDISPLINIHVILIATGVSISMGIISGFVPAYKAAKMKPIDALHFE